MLKARTDWLYAADWVTPITISPVRLAARDVRSCGGKLLLDFRGRIRRTGGITNQVSWECRDLRAIRTISLVLLLKGFHKRRLLWAWYLFDASVLLPWQLTSSVCRA